VPEFSIFDRDAYSGENDDDLPATVMHTNIGTNDLLPLPSEFTLDYQKVHWELERWTIFRALPMIMGYDKVMTKFFQGVNDGSIKVPDFMNTINPP
jgi:hypothetical protein